MPRPRKGDPELLLVSFCDIVTITTAAMFMAMIVVIDESSRIPAIRPMPMMHETTNAAVYYECRQNEVFYIDRDELARIFTDSSTKFLAEHQSAAGSVGVLSDMMHQDIGNDIYRIDDRYLMMGALALLPKEGQKGTTIDELNKSTNNVFRQTMAGYDPAAQYFVFLVRDDSFAVFRKARDIVTSKRFSSGWDFLEREEPITFYGNFSRIKAQ